MARAAIAVTTTVTNTSKVQTETVYAAGLTGTGGLYIPGTADVDDRVFLYIRETADGATGLAWVKSGDFDAAGQGDLAIVVGGSAALVVGPLERARFGQSDGTIEVDTGCTGVFSVISGKI